MIYGNFIIEGFNNNSCFGPNDNNATAPFIALRESLKKHHIEINTKDSNINKKVSFEIHIDKQKLNEQDLPIFLFLWETSLVKQRNKTLDPRKYKKVYTWDDNTVATKKYNKFYLPVPALYFSHFQSFEARTGFCCAISSNKAISGNYSNDLYKERIKLYEWFERNAPQDFDLYGIGWDKPIKKSMLKNPILSLISHKLNIGKKFLKIYKGRIESKSSILQNYKYSVCYENVCGLEGYITEKIFDSMCAGCIPIYWGASNISSYIPENCYIDRRNFPDEKSLYEFLKSIDEHTYLHYQEAISKFLKTDKLRLFSVENFASNISSDIYEELNDSR